MSRAFVKEDGPEPSDDLPERPVSDAPNYVTRRGLDLLEKWEARLAADFAALPSEQVDPTTRKRKRAIERDLRYVRARLESALPVDDAARPKGEVRFGARVQLRRADGAERTLRIVGEDEAAEGGELVPWNGPFVLALMGLKPGATLDWEGQGGLERWSVVAVE